MSCENLAPLSVLDRLVRIEALEPEFIPAARALAEALILPFADQAADARFALQLGRAGLQLAELGPQAPGPIRVDFVLGALAHRRLFGGGSGQLIARAVGLSPGVRPTLLDATAGLGRDAFVLANLGCEVDLIERHPLIAALLDDGLQRLCVEPELAAIASRMRLRQGDAIQWMRGWAEAVPQVIYLDPMFPHRDKTSWVKKEMRLFRPLVGDDNDAPTLLVEALRLATHRVVVKRPRQAPAIAGEAPSYALLGKSSRFDVYAKKSLKVKSANPAK